MRRNGLQGPHDVRQIVAAVIYILDGVIFAMLAIRLDFSGTSEYNVSPISSTTHLANWLPITGFYAAWLGVGVVGILVTAHDPGASKKVEDPAGFFCSECTKYVRVESKHCWTCQKCVAGFDHHCPWLNNCIGETNYRSFVVLVSLVVVMLSVLCRFAMKLFMSVEH